MPSGVNAGPLRIGDDAGTVLEAPVQLLDRLVDVGEGEERHAEDPIPVAEAPVVVEPPVERPEDVDGGFDVGLHRAFHADALRREQPGGFDALLVHAPQTRVAVEPLGMLGRVLAGQLVAETSLVAGAGEVVVERAGPRAHVHVAGAGDDRVEPPAVEHVARLAVDVDEADAAFGELGVAVAGERVARLPVVVVGVEDGRDLFACRRHGRPPQSLPCRRRWPGVASVHSPSMKVVTPLTMMRS